MVGAFLFATAAASARVPTTAEGWRALAKSDLIAVHDILRDNHPAVYVKRDGAAFRDWLERGYREGLRDLPKVRDLNSYFFLVRHYANGFRDAHIVLFPMADFPAKNFVTSWPGFAAQWRNGSYVVGYVDPAEAALAPPTGAKLINCDGESAERLAQERLDLYEGDLHLPLQRAITAAALLRDRHNPFVGSAPSHCTFTYRGATQTYTLHYSPFTPDSAKKVASANLDWARPMLGVQSWGDRRWWVGVPSLDTGLDWDHFFADMNAHLSAIRAADVVVIDVRGNEGGASRIVTQLLKTLWGDDMMHAHAVPSGDVTFRTSDRERAELAKSLSDLQADPKADPEELAWTKSMLAKLDATQKAGRKLFTVPSDFPAQTKGSPSNPVKGHVVLLADSHCVSACLDLIDRVRAMPNVVLAGQETSADTIFMDVVEKNLPSGFLGLNYGRMALQNRPRPSNVTYKPAPSWTYRGDLGSDAAWRTWLDEALRRNSLAVASR